MDDPMIPSSDVELLKWASPWLNTLVVNILRRRLNFRMIESKVQRDWACKDMIQTIDLHDGPWIVANHYLLVQCWRHFFLINAEKSKNVARIFSNLGKFLKVDKLMLIHLRGKFARICVELDLEKNL
ncbi:hypothetical protein D0Y65_023648 [Glycine soja]|uniref:DUF4283 domain-containing protein n=2 Tax=Glycine subgen. Soja TaxID=1462606 RepID=A0A0R0IFT0_SOYBN|nr:hypothetical protein D0Y65_023648 [Glycine soja]